MPPVFCSGITKKNKPCRWELNTNVDQSFGGKYYCKWHIPKPRCEGISTSTGDTCRQDDIHNPIQGSPLYCYQHHPENNHKRCQGTTKANTRCEIRCTPDQHGHQGYYCKYHESQRPNQQSTYIPKPCCQGIRKTTGHACERSDFHNPIQGQPLYCYQHHPENNHKRCQGNTRENAQCEIRCTPEQHGYQGYYCEYHEKQRSQDYSNIDRQVYHGQESIQIGQSIQNNQADVFRFGSDTTTFKFELPAIAVKSELIQADISEKEQAAVVNVNKANTQAINSAQEPIQISNVEKEQTQAIVTARTSTAASDTDQKPKSNAIKQEQVHTHQGNTKKQSQAVDLKQEKIEENIKQEEADQSLDIKKENSQLEGVTQDQIQGQDIKHEVTVAEATNRDLTQVEDAKEKEIKVENAERNLRKGHDSKQYQSIDNATMQSQDHDHNAKEEKAEQRERESSNIVILSEEKSNLVSSANGGADSQYSLHVEHNNRGCSMLGLITDPLVKLWCFLFSSSRNQKP